MAAERFDRPSKAIVANGTWGQSTQDVVKDFQINNEESDEGSVLEVDGWVGAKTETALMKRTGTTPPGRHGGKKVSPNPWDKLLPDHGRSVEGFAKMWLYALEHGRHRPPSREAQIKCVLRKLSEPLADRVYRYMDTTDMSRFFKTALPDLLPRDRTGGPDRQIILRKVVERHVENNLKRQLINEHAGWTKRMSIAAVYDEFRKRVYKLWLEIVDSLIFLNHTYGTNQLYTQSINVKLIHNWAFDLHKEEFESGHIFTCFPTSYGWKHPWGEIDLE